MNVRTRFAPSPTGELHLGNVHTALFAWAYARRAGGSFVVRFEDTDAERLVPGAEEAILGDLRWLGLDWDEGPDRGGPYGPYRQTERLDLYAEAAGRLLAEGRAYHCFCSAEDLARRREEALRRGEPPRYDGRCRDLPAEEVHRRLAALEAAGERPALRFRLPDERRELVVDDLVHGPTAFDLADLDDFLLVRPTGMPLYNFAVVVDDASMAITHVIRAEEHLSNTPRQVLLFEALGAPVPRFAHLPMLLGPGRRKLSKREAATALGQYREAGYLPQAVLNFLALLGWSDPEGREFLSAAELCARFSLDRVGRSAGIFDPERLRWMNREYLRRLTPEALWAALCPFLARRGHLAGDSGEERLRAAAFALREEAGDLVELAELLDPFWPGPSPAPDAEAAKALASEAAGPALRAAGTLLADLAEGEWSRPVLNERLHALPPVLGLGPGKVFRPLRAALTGRTSGPELALVLWLLGRDLALARLGSR